MIFSSFGESHGPAIGGLIEGCCGGLYIDFKQIDEALRRRRQGDAPIEGQPPLALMVTPRQEPDEVEWLSGFAPDTVEDSSKGVTLGTPIAFLIRNHCANSAPYESLQHCYRPGHADFTYQQRYGIRDWRGGGHASGRETAARVVAGNIALQMLQQRYPIAIQASYSTPLDSHSIEEQRAMLSADTFGGSVRCVIEGLPAGIGNPQKGKLNALLAKAMMSIPSAIGFEMGIGRDATEMSGRIFADQWRERIGNEGIGSPTLTNHCGGIQGGISNGNTIEFAVHFHAVVTQPEGMTCLTEQGSLKEATPGGRHDRCHLPRLAVVVESMAALSLAELM